MLLENRYQLDPKTDLIGQGGFAKVYKAKDTKFDMPVAIKHFIGSKGNTGSVTGEIKKCIHLTTPISSATSIVLRAATPMPWAKLSPKNTA